MNLVVFDVCVGADHPSLDGHFPGDPVVPGVVLLDAVIDGIERASDRRVVELRQVKFTAALKPDEVTQVRCDIAGTRASFVAITHRDGREVPVASGTLGLHSDPPERA